jgi:hypothetical protein
MFDGLMMNIAADEIEMLRARVKDLEARAAAHAQPIGEDAANVAIGEREAFEEAFRRNFEFPEHADQFTFRKGWEAGIMQARAALTAEKVAAEPDLSAENWASVFHTAFRHAGDSESASAAHSAIEAMDNKEWLQIVDYMLIGIRRKLAAPQQPAQSAEQDERAAFLSGHDVEELFLRWSEWTTELGEAISRKNIDGFVSDLRALLGEK